jgi:hypothetical protein
LNKSTSFQSISDGILSGILPRRLPAFLAVWGGQTERETPLCNIKLHAARVRVCVGLAALVRVSYGVGGQPVLEVGVVGADMGKAIRYVQIKRNLKILHKIS